MQKAVIYARVSSDRQEKEGYSIPAQISLLKEYAAKQSFIIDKIFSESETAKRAGRKSFNEMIEYIKKKNIKVILVEKTDRLYRNFKDYILLEDNELEIHLVKENSIISKNAKSHDKFIHGIKVLMAKNYIDNLSEEVQKGMLEKVKEGYFPEKAPIGYLNVRAEGGKNIIVIDKTKKPYIQEIFKLYSLGYSMDRIREILYEEGFTNRGKKYSKASIAYILKNPFYAGKIKFKGIIYDGKHEPTISLELFEKVQSMFVDTKTKSHDIEFAYTGLIHCQECGCILTAELKKGKYIYYHCTGNKGGSCKRHYIREENIEASIAEVLKQISDSIPDNIAVEIKKALKELHKMKIEFDDNSIDEITKHIKILDKRLENLYLDKIDGKISEEFWSEKNLLWNEEKATFLNKLQILNNSSKNFIESSNLFLNFANRVNTRFLNSSPQIKRQIVKLVCSNLYYKGGKLTVKLNSTFEYLLNCGLSNMVGGTVRHWNFFFTNLHKLLSSELIETIKLIA